MDLQEEVFVSVDGESDSRGLVEVARPSEVYTGMDPIVDYTEGRGPPCVDVHLSDFTSASDGCRVRKKGAHFKQPPVSPLSTTAQ